MMLQCSFRLTSLKAAQQAFVCHGKAFKLGDFTSIFHIQHPSTPMGQDQANSHLHLKLLSSNLPYAVVLIEIL